jgi:hypothetical protein
MGGTLLRICQRFEAVFICEPSAAVPEFTDHALRRRPRDLGMRSMCRVHTRVRTRDANQMNIKYVQCDFVSAVSTQ